MGKERRNHTWAAGPQVLRDPGTTVNPVDAAIRRLPGQVSVLIAGAGPVGSALAIELSRRGVVPLVVDRDTEIETRNVRARNISIRTLELARQWGVADRFRERQALPDDWYRGMVIRTRIAGYDLCEPVNANRPAWTPHADWDELSPEPPQDLPQYHVTRILRDRALSLGASFALGWEVIDLDQDADGVRVVVRDREGRIEEIVSDYVVGCDGVRSTVRQAADIKLGETPPLGRLFNVVFRLPNAFAQLELAPAALMFVFNQDVAGMVSPIDGDHWRIGVGPVPLDTELDEEHLVEHLRLYLGRDVTPEILSVSSYVVQKRIAETRRRGRVLLAGDASQAFPPHLGQNLNAGVGDAETLGWTLSAVVRGWGGDRLLDAYDFERQAVAHRLGDATLKITAATADVETLVRGYGDIERDDPDAVASRADLGRIIREVMGSGADGLVFDLRHPDSPAVVADGSEEPPADPHRYIPSSRPGHRAPHAWIAPGDPLGDHFGLWFTVLDLGAEPGEADAIAGALAAASVPYTVVAVRDEAIRRLYDRPLVIVRPDRVVAWRGHRVPDDIDAVVGTIRGVRRTARVGAPA